MIPETAAQYQKLSYHSNTCQHNEAKHHNVTSYFIVTTLPMPGQRVSLSYNRGMELKKRRKRKVRAASIHQGHPHSW